MDGPLLTWTHLSRRSVKIAKQGYIQISGREILQDFVLSARRTGLAPCMHADTGLDPPVGLEELPNNCIHFRRLAMSNMDTIQLEQYGCCIIEEPDSTTL